jgi:acyl-CoA thioesterase YciA
MVKHKAEPEGQLATRTLAMPKDANVNGDIFGGWVVSQMDIAGASAAFARAKARVATVAIDSMSFLSPVHVGDFVCCYAQLLKVGTTSMHYKVSTWTIGRLSGERQQVTEGIFIYVAIDENGRPIPVPADSGGGV